MTITVRNKLYICSTISLYLNETALTKENYMS